MLPGITQSGYLRFVSSEGKLKDCVSLIKSAILSTTAAGSKLSAQICHVSMQLDKLTCVVQLGIIEI